MPTATYIPLQTITLGSSASSVTFGSIPNTYRDLVLVAAGGTPAQADIQLRFNGDSGNNYSRVVVAGDGTNAFSFSESSQAQVRVGFWNNAICNLVTQIQDYSATDKHKTVLARGNGQNDGGARATAGRWANTAAINSIQVSSSGGTLNSGSTFSLYGIAG